MFAAVAKVSFSSYISSGPVAFTAGIGEALRANNKRKTLINIGIERFTLKFIIFPPFKTT